MFVNDKYYGTYKLKNNKNIFLFKAILFRSHQNQFGQCFQSGSTQFIIIIGAKGTAPRPPPYGA
jgi:hypothetical protein